MENSNIKLSQTTSQTTSQTANQIANLTYSQHQTLCQALSTMNLRGLDSHIKQLVASERQVTDKILKAITELDVRRGYAELGFSSLFAYLTLGVGYSESSAQRRIAAARLMTKVSESNQTVLRNKLQSGAINLSQLSKIGSLIHSIEQSNRKGVAIKNSSAFPSANITIGRDAKDNSNTTGNPRTSASPNANANANANAIIEHLLPQIQNQDLAKTESAIADTVEQMCPGLQTEPAKTQKAKVRQAADGKVSITLSLSKAQHEKLKKVLAKKSHSLPNGDITLLFEKLLDKELKGYDGVIQCKTGSAALGASAVSATSYTTGTNATATATVNSGREIDFNKLISRAPSLIEPTPLFPLHTKAIKTKSRKYISIKIKRRVFTKAHHQCEYISDLTGERCRETKFLTIDHIQPLALGGLDLETNYRACCFTHNLAEAKRMGINKGF